MTREEQLKNLIISRYESVKHFSEVAGLPYTTIHAILNRGVMNSNVQNVIKICDVLGISVDALADNKIVPVVKSKSNVFDMIGEQLKSELQSLATEKKYLSQDDINFFTDSMQIVIEQLKRRNKGANK